MMTAHTARKGPFKAQLLSAEKWFWLFVVAHIVLWTLIPTLVSPNAPLDVIEGYAWGREWLLGTHKHPPMQAWWLETLAFITQRAPWAHFFASQVAISLAFWAVWKTSLEILSPTAALASVLILEGVIFYNYTTPEFNPNVLQIACWGLIGYTFYKAVKENRLQDWVLFGVWSAAGLYSKYFTALFLAVLGLFMITQAQARRHFFAKGPYIAVAVGFLLFLPHLIWLKDCDFLPLFYTQQRLDIAPHTCGAPLTLQFLFKQLVIILPAGGLVVLLNGFNKPQKSGERILPFDRNFLAFIVLGPFVLTCLLGLFFGFKLKSMWGSPFWNFLGIGLLTALNKQNLEVLPRRFLIGWAVIFVAALCAFGLVVFLQPYASHNAKKVHFPGQILAQRVNAAWKARFPSTLKYVIGDVWAAGNVAYYMPDRPHVFIEGDRSLSPWIAQDAVQENGGVWLEIEREEAYQENERSVDQKMQSIQQAYPDMIVQPPLVLPPQTGAEVPSIKICWGIIPPAMSVQAQQRR